MEIAVTIADANGALLTGKAASTALKIRRVADGYLLDWSDLVFKASGWGSLSTPLVEVDATNLPGVYEKVVTSTAWADGFYHSLVHFDDGTMVSNYEDAPYIQGGREVELNLDAAVSSRAIPGDVMGKSPADVVDWQGATAPALTGDPYAAAVALGVVVDTVKADTAAILLDTAEIGTTGAGLTTITDKTNLIPAVPASQADTQAVPAAVWAVSVRTLSTFGTLVADIATAVWGAGTKVLTGFGTLVADTATAVWGAGTKALTDKAGFTISGAKQTLDALQDLSQAGAQAGATAALNAYDPPTRAQATADKAEITAMTTKVLQVLANRLVVVPATGAFTIYKDDGVTPLLTGTISGTGRSVPLWP
jgi:hypothetical protein